MSESDDEIREILGDELYEELDSIDAFMVPQNIRELLEEHARLELEDIDIDVQEYITIPIPVEYASFIAQSMSHYITDQCEKCREEIGTFTFLVLNVIKETLEAGGYYENE